MPFTHTTESKRLLTNTLNPVMSFSTRDQDRSSFDAKISNRSKSDKKAPRLFIRRNEIQAEKNIVSGYSDDRTKGTERMSVSPIAVQLPSSTSVIPE